MTDWKSFGFFIFQGRKKKGSKQTYNFLYSFGRVETRAKSSQFSLN